MFFIEKFKEWWNIIDFRNNVINLIKESTDVKKNITSFFFVILVFSFISALWKSFSKEFMIGSLIFNTVKDTIYYSVEILLIGLLIYFVLRYIFKKNVLSKNFFRMNGLLSFLILIIAGIIIGLIFSPVFKLESPDSINKITIDYNAEGLSKKLGMEKPNYDREEIRSIALNAVKKINNENYGSHSIENPVFKDEKWYVVVDSFQDNRKVYNVVIDDKT